MPNYMYLMKYRKLMEQKALYESWKQSRLTKAEFCRQNSIIRQTFYVWIKQLQNNNYIDDYGNEETLNIFDDANNIDDTNTLDDDINLETESIKFLKVSELFHTSSQKSADLGSSTSGTLGISSANGTVVKATVSQDCTNSFL